MKFLKALWRKLKFWDSTAAKSITNPIEERKLVIEEASDVISDFKKAIAESMVHIKSIESNIQDCKTDIEKYTALASIAVKKGRDDNARSFLQRVETIKKELTEFEKDYNVENKFLEVNKKKLENETNKLNSAKNQTARLETKYKAAETHEKLSNLRNSDAFNAIDKLEDAVDNKLNYAAALDELNTDSLLAIEDAYSNDIQNASVELELEKLKNSLNEGNN